MVHKFVIKDVLHLYEHVKAHLHAILQNSTILLLGEMGAGKTTFVSTLSAQLGAMITASSPTFAIVNEYPLASPVQLYQRIIHMDLYRLKHTDEVIRAGLEDYLYHPSDLVIIEWPELILPLINEPYTVIRIEVNEQLWRTFTITHYPLRSA